MNRPNKKDYCNGFLYNTDKYVTSLEHYCDELEQRCLSDEWNLSCLDKDCRQLERENKELKAQIDRYKRLNPDDLSWTINPCSGCKDYCYKNDKCKSNGGCAKEDE